MSRLTIELTEQQHQSIKALAALQGRTIKDFALERLFREPGDDAQALTDLKDFLTERLAQAGRGEVSTRGVTEVAQETIRALGAE